MKSFMKIFIPLSFFLCSSVNAEVVVIVNTANGNSLDKNFISRIYQSKKKSFPDGSKIQAVSQVEANPVTQEFAVNVIGKSLSQIKAYRSKLIFTGKGVPPKELASDADVIAFVSQNPNAIGFVSSGSENDTVKVVGKF